MTRDSSPPEAALATVRAGLPGLAASRISTSSAPCRAQPRAAGRDGDVDGRLPHREVGELAGHGAAEPLGGRPAGLASSARGRGGAFARRAGATSGSSSSIRLSELEQRVEALGRRPSPGEHVVDGLAVLAGEGGRSARRCCTHAIRAGSTSTSVR